MLEDLGEGRGITVAVTVSEGAALATMGRALTAGVRHGEDRGEGGLEALGLHAGAVRVEHDGDVPYDTVGREGRSRRHRHGGGGNRRGVGEGGVGGVGGDEVARTTSRARAERKRIRDDVDGRYNSGITGVSGVSMVARIAGVAGIARITRVARVASRISRVT